MTDEEAVRRLEVESRRGLGQALHPDRCPKLTLHGVGFAIPPRRARIVPAFARGSVDVHAEQADDWPQADRLLKLAEIAERQPCPECGQPRSVSLVVAVERSGEFLRAAFALAGELLDRQYRLTPKQKADLLTFEADRPPIWIAELLEWCS